MFILIIIAVIVIIVIVRGKSLGAARVKNSVVTFGGPEGLCCECKHCVKDTGRKNSETDWFCTLYKCDHITEQTRMRCFEKPKVTEDDLRELFALGIWNSRGQQYIRQTLLGKAMTFSELDQFLQNMRDEHPEYLAK